MSGVKFSPKPVLQSVAQLTHNLVVSKSILSIFASFICNSVELLQIDNILSKRTRAALLLNNYYKQGQKRLVWQLAGGLDGPFHCFQATPQTFIWSGTLQ